MMPPARPPRSPHLPLFVTLGTLLAFFWRFGYGYGSSDQDELLPFLYHLMDPNLFTADWFVQTQVTHFSVRTYFVWLLRAACVGLPVWLAVTILYLGLWLWITRSAYRLAMAVHPDRLAGATAVFAGLAVTHKWTLGGNDLVYTMLVPEMLAWALALSALWRFMEGDRARPAFLLGLAAWFQLLVGLLTAGVLGLMLVWRWWTDRARFGSRREVLAFGVVFLLASLPAAIPIVLQQVQAQSLAPDPSVFYILGPFRNPFHHMAFSFGLAEWATFLTLLAASGLAFFHLRPGLDPTVQRFLTRFAVIVAGLCIAGIVFTELVPVLLVLKFQVYKLTVPLKFLAVVLLCAGLASLLPERLHEGLVRLLDRPLMGWLVVGSLLIGTLALIGHDIGRPARNLRPLVHATSPLARIEHWARTQTDADAVFAVPPSISTFRSNARRAMVVNYSAFPFNDADMQIWYRRLTAVAPIEPPDRGLEIAPVLDAAFHAQNAAAWRHLSERYQIDYLVINGSLANPDWSFEDVHREDPWIVYRLPASVP